MKIRQLRSIYLLEIDLRSNDTFCLQPFTASTLFGKRLTVLFHWNWPEKIDISTKLGGDISPPFHQHHWPQDEETTLLFCSSYNKFCNRPYFSRAWIIQELFGGRGRTIVLYGTYQLHCDALFELAARLDMYSNAWESISPYSGEVSESIDRIAALLNLPTESSLSLPELLYNLLLLDYHDPRDLIFTTLRLIVWSQFGKSTPVPDYRKSQLDLAFDLMELLDDPHLLVTSLVLILLELRQPTSGLVEWLQIRFYNHELLRLPCSHRDIRKYSSHNYGARLVQVDDSGRLSVDLEVTDRFADLSVPERIDLPSGTPYHRPA
jgi:hypothetical protein